MASRINSNSGDFRRELKAIESDIPGRVFRPLARYANTRLGARMIGSYMRDAKGEPKRRSPADTGPLRIVMGRLSRAANIRFDAAGGGLTREGRIELQISPEGMTFEKIVAVVYAAVHEYGSNHSVPVTAKMRRFFWAMFFETGDEKWKAMALTKKTEFRLNIPARPYAAPSLEDELPNIAARAEQLLFQTIQSRVGE